MFLSRVNESKTHTTQITPMFFEIGTVEVDHHKQHSKRIIKDLFKIVILHLYLSVLEAVPGWRYPCMRGSALYLMQLSARSVHTVDEQ